MKIPRMRLRSWLILVLLSALVMGAVVQVSRMQPIDWGDLSQQLIVLGPFVLMVALKAGLAATSRWHRSIDAERTAGEGSRGDSSLP